MTTAAPPLVSYVIPTANRPLHLRKAVSSAARQRYGPIEIVVVNDGPEVCRVDGKDFVIRDVVAEAAEGRPLIYVPSADSNRGAAETRNEGLRMANGEQIAYLDDDDTHSPDHVPKSISQLQRKGVDGTVSGLRTVYQEAGKPDRSNVYFMFPFVRPLLPVANFYPPSGLIHRNLGKPIWNPNIRLTNDWDAWQRLVFAEGLTFGTVHDVTGDYYRALDREAISNKILEPGAYLKVCEASWARWRPYWEGDPEADLTKELIQEHRRFQLGEAPETRPGEELITCYERFLTRLHNTYFACIEAEGIATGMAPAMG